MLLLNVFLCFSAMAQTTYHIRVAFSSYEKSYLTEYLHSYLAEIKRHNPLADHCRLRRSCRTTDVIANCQSRLAFVGRGALGAAGAAVGAAGAAVGAGVAAQGWVSAVTLDLRRSQSKETLTPMQDYQFQLATADNL